MVDFWEIRNVEDVSKTMITKGVKASRFEVDEGICFEDICTYQYSRWYISSMLYMNLLIIYENMLKIDNATQLDQLTS